MLGERYWILKKYMLHEFINIKVNGQQTELQVKDTVQEAKYEEKQERLSQIA